MHKEEMSSALTQLTGADNSVFINEYYGKSHKVFRGAMSGTASGTLFSLQTIESILRSGGLRTSSIRVVRNGQNLDPSALGRADSGDPETAEPLVDPLALAGALADGYTLMLRNIHHVDAELARFAAVLSEDIGQPVLIFAFITPPSAQGLKLHYDTDDVFVIQVQGKKEWILHETDHKLPLKVQDWHLIGTAKRDSYRESSRRIAEVTLEVGDVMYIPRGCMHAGRTVGGPSTHISVAIRPVTRYSMMEQLLVLARDDYWFREAVPVGLGRQSHAAILEAVREGADRLAKIANSADVESLEWSARKSSWTDWRATPLPVLSLAAVLADPSQADTYRVKPGGHWYLSEPAESGFTVNSHDRQIKLPERLYSIVSHLLNGENVSYEEIKSQCGTSADDLLKALLRAGLIEPVLQAG